jgi:hypothetical protein
MTNNINEAETAARQAWRQLVDLANDTLLGKYPGKRVVFAPGCKAMFAADVTSVPSLITLFFHLDRPAVRRGPDGRVLPTVINVDDIAKITVFARREV